ncbi:MAG: nitrogenase iron protein [Thermoprotei archaeon]|nr:MAG: nitrogenase iron protein [Thermoprotei archaeon]
MDRLSNHFHDKAEGFRRPLQIAFYGKGGTGKSTVASNVAAALGAKGYRVLVVGCDPKHDCTSTLRGGRDIPTILDTLRKKGIEKRSLDEIIEGKSLDLTEVVFQGAFGTYVAEAGGPRPGHGCAGRGIIVAIEALKKLRVFEQLNLDVVIYDVLGDVVCGGFAMPLRMGLADAAYIVTSADFLSLYAANNVCRGIAEFAMRGGCLLGGFIYNVRSALIDVEDVVNEFSRAVGATIIEKIPYSPLIVEAEVEGKTVIEYSPESDIAQKFHSLASKLISNKERVVPTPLPWEKLVEMGRILQENVRRKFKEKVMVSSSNASP